MTSLKPIEAAAVLAIPRKHEIWLELVGAELQSANGDRLRVARVKRIGGTVGLIVKTKHGISTYDGPAGFRKGRFTRLWVREAAYESIKLLVENVPLAPASPVAKSEVAQGAEQRGRVPGDETVSHAAWDEKCKSLPKGWAACPKCLRPFAGSAELLTGHMRWHHRLAVSHTWCLRILKRQWMPLSDTKKLRAKKLHQPRGRHLGAAFCFNCLNPHDSVSEYRTVENEKVRLCKPCSTWTSERQSKTTSQDPPIAPDKPDDDRGYDRVVREPSRAPGTRRTLKVPPRRSEQK